MVEFLYNKIVEVDMVSPMSLKRCVSVSVVELASVAKNGTTPFSLKRPKADSV